MVYRAIGLMSGSSLDGIDLVCATFSEQGGVWSYEIIAADCISYSTEWRDRLRDCSNLSAREYLLLHSEYGHHLGQVVQEFIQRNQLEFKISLISSHGHTSFHLPGKKMTAQLGDGSAIAAQTGLPVISDLRAMDIAFGGQGAPIVPIGEKLLWPGYEYYLNIGGIANVSVNGEQYKAFDICPANRVLNMLAGLNGKEFDEDGKMAASGKVNNELLKALNDLSYYSIAPPKSLANEFGTDQVFPMLNRADLSIQDALCTYTEHIAQQVAIAIGSFTNGHPGKMLVTGGGAFNRFLVGRIQDALNEKAIELVIPDPSLINNKEAVVMAFMGVLRWRQEYNVLSSVTGAVRNSIGGALWTGEEA